MFRRGCYLRTSPVDCELFLSFESAYKRVSCQPHDVSQGHTHRGETYVYYIPLRPASLHLYTITYTMYGFRGRKEDSRALEPLFAVISFLLLSVLYRLDFPALSLSLSSLTASCVYTTHTYTLVDYVMRVIKFFWITRAVGVYETASYCWKFYLECLKHIRQNGDDDKLTNYPDDWNSRGHF